MPDPTDELMAGLDAARPVPAELRERLEHALLGTTHAEGRPLEPDLAERLQGALADPVAGAMEGLDAPRPLDTDLRQRLEHVLQPRSQRPRLVMSAAAVLIVLAGVGLAFGLSGSKTPTSQQSSRAVTGTPGPGPHRSDFGSAGIPGGGAVTNIGPAVPQQGGPSASSGAAAAASPSPTIAGVTPDNGPSAGGTWVTISGSGLNGVQAVSFGGVPAQFVPVSDSSVRALAPAHAAGTVDIQVTTASGTTLLSPEDHYSFS